ncbi:hypothetical protein FIV42_24275 [Persicimonas caeni]|uniref:Bacterial virulence factor lipase N-terminal domain-containing protein n=1 Tax=Persicimonas caeni TaxID=2292766 RepID=A0A4Y6PZJ6_PERCE|nr:hypothetical protein [Persicimonas caeni]QDG53746.1 hypothetical protein FIV42_24275 [Persicimonas caeni]QED34967.1 hypothetical protein FRD00_24270 [Persicimonas caeni]
MYARRLPLAALVAALVATFAVACSDDDSQTNNQTLGDVGPDSQTDAADTSDDADAAVDLGTRVRFDPTSDDFFSVPFPSDTRRKEDGSFGFSDWDGAYDNGLLKLWFDAADDLMDGWGLVSGVFVHFSEPIDPSTLPQTIEASTSTDEGFPSVFLMDVDPDSPQQGEMLPIDCKFTEGEGTIHDANLLGCISPFGVVRRPNTRYAFVVTTQVTDTDGEPLVPDAAMAELLAGEDVEGVNGTVAAQPYIDAKELLTDAGLSDGAIASITLFTTGDPASRLVRINEYYRNLPDPQFDPSTLTFVEELDDYVVLRGTYEVPIIQAGERPYSSPPDGKIVFDDSGVPVEQAKDSVPFLVTIPKTPMPEGGFPVLMYMHGSGGEMQELIDRGARPDLDTPAPHGTGPGGVVAPYGIAGFAAEFPFHGTRFSPPDTTGLKLYDLLNNPRATVDNFIVSANEVTLHARLLANVEIDPSVANDLVDTGDAADGKIRFNADSFTAMGQSMGSTIGLPALTVSEEIDAGILSGSGGTLIETALESIKPFRLKPILKRALGYRNDEVLDRYDIALSAVQQTWDFVDPVVHARHAIHEPHPNTPAKHILQHSGIDDGYFSVESRTALSGALGIDFAEPVAETEALDLMTLIAPDHAQPLATPVSANIDGTMTGVVGMYEPSVMDGHNVAYQRDDAKAQYACFVKTVGADGAPEFRAVQDAQPETCE